MSESYRALCTDFYVNLKVSLKMELPRTRETVLDFFERTRRQFGTMNQFRRYRDELALESVQADAPHRWLALRSSNIRAGCVNPDALADAYALHKHVLETAPAYLSVSPLDVEYIELLFGFDLSAHGNHDAIVLDALIPGSPLSAILEIHGATPIDCQPVVGLSLGDHGDTEVYFEVKTRSANQPPKDGDPGEPISIYLTLRKFGPYTDTKELPAALAALAERGEDLVEHRVVPGLLVPIREVIASGNS